MSNSMEKLVNEVKILIADLKKEYFQQNEPLTDDEPLIHKLCMRLENVLRFGAREKYSFLGVRKDYWNFLSESVPKDECVKHVQSIPDFKTNPGKGRAFLREALVQRSLADTLQRAIISTRNVKDFYGPDSVIRSEKYFQALMQILYDLNVVEFYLPHQGYDLDKGFPSFARKTFNSQLSTSSSRRTSISSVQSFQPDPLQNLRTNVSLIELVINAWLGKVTEHIDNNEEVSLLQLIDKLALFREHILLLKSKNTNEVEVLKDDIERLKAEKLKSDALAEQRLNLVHDHYKSRLDIDTSASGEKLKILEEKLKMSEGIIAEVKSKWNDDIANFKNIIAKSQEENEMLKHENKELNEFADQCKSDLSNAKEMNISYMSTNKVLEGKLSEIQKMNASLKLTEKEVAERNSQLEQTLKIKETEINVLQDAFQKSSGSMTGSVEELKEYIYSQQTKTSEVVDTIRSSNEGLLNDYKALQTTNNELSFQIQVLEENLSQEKQKKLETEKIVSDLKGKYTEDMKQMADMQLFVSEVCDVLNEVNNELDDVEGDGLVSPRYNKDNCLHKIVSILDDVEQGKTIKEQADQEIKKLQSELSELTQSLDDTTKQLDLVSQVENDHKDLEAQNAKLNTATEILNGKIYDMSVEIIGLKENLAMKEKEKDRDRDSYSLLLKEMEQVQAENEKIKVNFDEKDNELNDIKIIAEQKDKELNDIKIMVEQKEKELNDIKISAEQKDNELNDIKIIAKQKDNELNDIKMIADQKDKELHDMEAMAEKLNEVKGKREKDYESVHVEKENLVSQCNELNQQIATISKEYEEFKFNQQHLFQESWRTERSDLIARNEEYHNHILEIGEELEEEKSKHEVETELWKTEKERLIAESEELDLQCRNANDKHMVAEETIKQLQGELSQQIAEKEKERASHDSTSIEVNTLMEELRLKEDEYTSSIAVYKQDLEDIKTLLVTSTQEKHDLWEKKEHLEQELIELKEQFSERWVIDTEVTKCTNCEGTFTLTRRKHHCRLCGQIFCNDCSNRWIKLSDQRKKKVRSCNRCADSHEEKSDFFSRNDTISSTPDSPSFLSGEIPDVDTSVKENVAQNESTLDEVTNDESMTDEVTHYESALDGQNESTIDEPEENSTVEVDNNGSMFEEATTGDFEILAADDVSTSNACSFGVDQQVRILTSDTIIASLIPVCHTDTDLDINMENIDIEVHAGYRVVLPVMVPGVKMDLLWEFTSSPKDIGFGVAFMESEQESNQFAQTIVPISRYISHKVTINGKVAVDYPGTYYLLFDNSYSRLTQKTVYCKVGLVRSAQQSSENESES